MKLLWLFFPLYIYSGLDRKGENNRRQKTDRCCEELEGDREKIGYKIVVNRLKKENQRRALKLKREMKKREDDRLMEELINLLW